MSFTIRRSPVTDRFLILLLFSILVTYVLFARSADLPTWATIHDSKEAPVSEAPSSSASATPKASSPATINESNVDWSRFAYSTYATSEDALCNSLMIIESLHRLNVKAQKQLLHSRAWNIDAQTGGIGDLLRKARDEYNATLKPLDIIRADPTSVTDSTWIAGFTKLMAFNQTEYDRVLMVDSDATIMQSMDELFLLPASPVALPRAYWLKETLSDQIFLVEPSPKNVEMIQARMKVRLPDEYDMEIVNILFKDRCLILPHRPYNLITGEFRSKNHDKYLTDYGEKWDPEAVIKEAKFVHFSDWPLPKPWLQHIPSVWNDVRPKCEQPGGSVLDDCAERRIWADLYKDFRSRRERVCGAAYRTWGAVDIE